MTRTVFSPLALGLALACMSCHSHAQGATPPYNFLRYNEDYRYLQDPARRSDPWDPIKFIPLGLPGTYLGLGGEIRQRFENYSGPNFGVPGPSADGYLLHRILLHGDLHAGDYFRGFVQLGNHVAFGKNIATPPYEDRLDVQQAFVDIRLPTTANPAAPSNRPLLRVGRQEMAFGSQRLVSVRDAPNVRRAFDGARLGGRLGEVRLDAFATRPVLLKAGNFDDQPNHAQGFWGLYSTFSKTLIPAAGMDLYYLGFENSRALYSVGTGGGTQALDRRASVRQPRSLGLGLGSPVAIWQLWPAGSARLGNLCRHRLCIQAG